MNAVLTGPAVYPRLHMTLWSAIAVFWLVLGYNSGNVPVGSDVFWIIVSAVVAGAAVGVAHRASRNSLLVYLLAALVVGGIRSIAYITNDGSNGPAAVWTIITLTNVVLLLRWWDDG